MSSSSHHTFASGLMRKSRKKIGAQWSCIPSKIRVELVKSGIYNRTLGKKA